MRVSYSGYYAAFPRLKGEFDSLYPHHIMTKEVFRYVLKDRLMVAFIIVSLLLMVMVEVILFAWIRPSDIQIPIRYSGFGDTLFNDRWYERLTFPLFLLFQTIASIWIAMILHARRYRALAYYLILLSVFITVVTVAVMLAVIRTVTL